MTPYYGDCREIVPTLGKFDLLLTDPPYGINHPCVFKANTNGLPAFDTKGNDCGITTVRAHMAGMEGRRLTYQQLIADE